MIHESIGSIFSSVRRDMGIPENMWVDYHPGRIIFCNQWETELLKGYEITSDDPDLKLSRDGIYYHGTRVHIYIRDQMAYGYTGDPRNYRSHYKFHITHCSTLETMMNQGRYGRYVVSSSRNNLFKINLTAYDGKVYIGVVPDQKLEVCRNCLRQINYHNFKNVDSKEQDRIVDEFDLKEFYNENSSSANIHVIPQYNDVNQPVNQYSAHWTLLSASLREKYHYTCQECHRHFADNPSELHVHHIDGDKSNENPTNLIVLCRNCHNKKHQHMQKNITSSKNLRSTALNANRPTVDRSRILYFDTETTGLDPETDDLLQLSIIDDTGKRLYNSYFHPAMKKSWPEAERINHISPKKVANAPTFVQECDEIQAIFDEAEVLCGYNIGFDKKFLSANGISFRNDIRYIDILMLARRFVDTPNHKLTTVAQHLGFKFMARAAHDALGDVLATKFLREKLLPVI